MHEGVAAASSPQYQCRRRYILYNGFQNGFVSDVCHVMTRLFPIGKIERQQISFLHVHAFKIIAQLFYAVLTISFSSPYLQFDDELITTVINHHIHATFVTRLRFHIVMARAIDDGN